MSPPTELLQYFDSVINGMSNNLELNVLKEYFYISKSETDLYEEAVRDEIYRIHTERNIWNPEKIRESFHKFMMTYQKSMINQVRTQIPEDYEYPDDPELLLTHVACYVREMVTIFWKRSIRDYDAMLAVASILYYLIDQLSTDLEIQDSDEDRNAQYDRWYRTMIRVASTKRTFLRRMEWLVNTNQVPEYIQRSIKTQIDALPGVVDEASNLTESDIVQPWRRHVIKLHIPQILLEMPELTMPALEQTS